MKKRAARLIISEFCVLRSAFCIPRSAFLPPDVKLLPSRPMHPLQFFLLLLLHGAKKRFDVGVAFLLLVIGTGL
jgi:hypothetical protein